MEEILAFVCCDDCVFVCWGSVDVLGGLSLPSDMSARDVGLLVLLVLLLMLLLEREGGGGGRGRMRQQRCWVAGDGGTRGAG